MPDRPPGRHHTGYAGIEREGSPETPVSRLPVLAVCFCAAAKTAGTAAPFSRDSLRTHCFQFCFAQKIDYTVCHSQRLWLSGARPAFRRRGEHVGETLSRSLLGRRYGDLRGRSAW